MKLLLLIAGLLILHHQHKVAMEQIPQASAISAVEVAKTICLRKGEVYWGGEATGSSSTSVTLFPRCPEGRAIGIMHSHPGGTSIPSPKDIAEMKRANLPYMCVLGEEALSCYRVR